MWIIYGKDNMNKLLCFMVILYFMLNFVTSQAAKVDPDSLVKVTPDNNAKCVEYYNYKNALYCSTTAQTSQTVNPDIKHYEKLKITFDDRPWRIGWGKKE